MELKGVKDIPVREMLLSPFRLLHQISTSLLPGVLAIFIMMLKHSHLISTALSVTNQLGYKTRISLALLVALVIGRVIQAIVLIFSKAVGRLNSVINEKKESESTQNVVREKIGDAAAIPADNAEATNEPSPEILSPDTRILKSSEAKTESKVTKQVETKSEKRSKLTPEQQTLRHFFSGVVLGTVTTLDSPLFDSWEAARAHLALVVNSGFVLLFASFYPGDGLRVYEAVGGSLMIIMGVLQGIDVSHVRMELMGSALGQLIARHTIEENKEILQAASLVLPIVMKHINPTLAERAPVQIVTEIVEKSTPSRGVGQPQIRKKRRRK